jgi:hypothetical protein
VAASLSEAVAAIQPRGQAVARTELLRVYRTVMIRECQANDDLLIGWEWLAALQPQTCPVCLALDGTSWKPQLRSSERPAH